MGTGPAAALTSARSQVRTSDNVLLCYDIHISVDCHRVCYSPLLPLGAHQDHQAARPQEGDPLPGARHGEGRRGEVREFPEMFPRSSPILRDSRGRGRPEGRR